MLAPHVRCTHSKVHTGICHVKRLPPSELLPRTIWPALVSAQAALAPYFESNYVLTSPHLQTLQLQLAQHAQLCAQVHLLAKQSACVLPARQRFPSCCQPPRRHLDPVCIFTARECALDNVMFA